MQNRIRIYLNKTTMETKKTIEITVPEGMKIVEVKNDDGNVISYQLVPDKSKEQEMKEFLDPFLNNLTLVRCEDKYPDSVFFKQGDVVLFELWVSQNDKKRYLFTSYKHIWSVFYNRFGLNYYEIQEFIKTQVETALKLGDVTPDHSSTHSINAVETALKLGELTLISNS